MGLGLGLGLGLVLGLGLGLVLGLGLGLGLTVHAVVPPARVLVPEGEPAELAVGHHLRVHDTRCLLRPA